MKGLKGKEITSVVSLKTLQKIQDSFSTALEIPLSIRNIDGELLTKMSHESKLWSLVKKHPDTDGTLRIILKEAFQKCLRTGQAVIFERYIDTKAFVVPININGKAVAFFVGGLVRFGNPNSINASKEANKFEIDLDDYLEAYLDLSLFTEERLQAAANLVKVISNTISSLEFQGNEIKVKTEKVHQKNLELAKNLEKTSHALDKSQERFEKLFRSVNDGIYIADMHGRMIEINPAGAKMFGFENPEELTGKFIKDYYVNPDDRDRFVKILLRDGHIENFVAIIKTLQGNEKFYETNAILVKDNEGKPVAIQGIFRDIHERRIHNGIKSGVKKLQKE